MAISYKPLAALGLSTTLLGSVGHAACSNETPTDSQPASETAAPEEASSPDAATGPATTPAPVTSVAGEGEGGPGGEGGGGEGGVNIAAAAEDPAVYKSALALVEAHVRAATDALAEGRREAAAEMFAHPVSEILIDLEPVLQQQGVTPFDQDLIEASRAVFAGESAEEIKARADEIIVVLRNARAAAPDSDESEAVVNARVIADEIDRAIAQYLSAKNSDAYEPYLDGYGFYRTAQAILAENEARIRSEAPDFMEQAETILTTLSEAYPTADRPETLDADTSAMAVGNSELQLITSGL